MARAIAEKVRRQPALFGTAKQNLVRWKKIQRPWPCALREWDEIVDRHSMEEVLAILTEDSEEGRRLRQSSPFTGILTREERNAIFDRYDHSGA